MALLKKRTAPIRARDFLKPSNFVTDGDTDEGGAQAYCRGKAASFMLKEVHISVDKTWTAYFKEGGQADSRECFGVTADTAELLRGLLDSGVKISVSTMVDGCTVLTVIRERR